MSREWGFCHQGKVKAFEGKIEMVDQIVVWVVRFESGFCCFRFELS